MQTTAAKKYCYGCFRIIDENEEICNLCGYTHGAAADSAQCLLPGTKIHDQYIIGKVLGQGGFGITYLAYNTSDDIKVAIKEYYPDGVVTRTHGEAKVRVYSADLRESFELGVKKFFEEAKILAKFKDNPNIINVYSYFLENNTAYYVMEYIDGINLRQYLKQNGGTITTVELFKIIFPILDALDEVHQNNILHRDISPENIYITRNGVAKLLDFGAARQVFGDNNKSLSVVLKPGFAPEEQYRRKGIQGPWTDIYSLGATIYFALTAQNLPDALDRLRDDSETKMLSELVVGINSAIEAVIMKAVAPAAEDRYSSVKEFRNALISATLSDSSVNYHIKRAKMSSYSRKQAIKIGAIAVSIVMVSGIAVYAASLPGADNVFGLFKGNDLQNIDFTNSTSDTGTIEITTEFATEFSSTQESITPTPADTTEQFAETTPAMPTTKPTTQASTSASHGGTSPTITTPVQTTTVPLNSNDFEYKVYAENPANAAIIGYTGSGGNITIPGYIDGHMITTIEKEAFFGKRQITGIIMPDTLLTIGDWAFSTTGITKVIIGKNVQTIGSYAFSENKSLIEVTIGARVSNFGRSPFSNCNSSIVFNLVEGSYAHQCYLNSGIEFSSAAPTPTTPSISPTMPEPTTIESTTILTEP